MNSSADSRASEIRNSAAPGIAGQSRIGRVRAVTTIPASAAAYAATAGRKGPIERHSQVSITPPAITAAQAPAPRHGSAASSPSPWPLRRKNQM